RSSARWPTAATTSARLSSSPASWQATTGPRSPYPVAHRRASTSGGGARATTRRRSRKRKDGAGGVQFPETILSKQGESTMKFGYTILYVKDVEKTVAFYESAFGLKRKFVHESGYGEMDTGETKLAFASVELATSNGVPFVPANPEGPSPAVEVALVTDDVAEAFAVAVKAGAVPVAEPKQKPWGQTVGYVRDLNGVLIEICSPM